VDRAAQVVEAVLTDHPRMEVAALILADAALARALGATHVLPLLALTLKVAPKLRAKAAGRAVDLFLSRDALVPGALAFMSDRAARRLCDRLVALGAVRELTGRDTFRLYGV